MKKTLFGTFLWIFTLAGIAILPNYTIADNETGNTTTEDLITDWGSDTGGRKETTDNKNRISDASQKGSDLLTSIKNTIKWILGILATVAVVICLYAGFIMMTSAGDENKYKNGMKILKYAAIWLAIILLSWLIVSIVFWFVNINAKWGWVMDSGTPSS